MILETLHEKVRTDAEAAIDDAVERGAVDFWTVCHAVLAMEDSPRKARALARLGGFALWYADELRKEEEQEPAASELRVFTDSVEYVVATSAGDASAVWCDFTGETICPLTWEEPLADDAVVSCWRYTDGDGIAAPNEEGAELVSRTAAEWCRSQGRGYFCTTEC